MALLSLGENRWRMLRRVVKRKQFKYEDARNITRHDQAHFDRLVANGFFAASVNGTFEVTDNGKAAADLGRYEWKRGVTTTPPAAKPRKG